MAWVRDTERSIRDNIMEHLKDRFETVRAGTNRYTTTWNMVLRAPLTKQSKIIGDSVSILDLTEKKDESIGQMTCRLRVAIEFVYVMKIGDEPLTELNRILVDIQRLMRSDIQAGGLCLNIVESSSELDLDGPEDRLVGGIVFWEVLYKHATQDPTKHR